MEDHSMKTQTTADDCMWCRYGDSPFGPDCPIHGPLTPETIKKIVHKEDARFQAWLREGERQIGGDQHGQ